MFSESVNPPVAGSKKIIRKPQVFGPISFPKLEHFIGDILWSPDVERIAVDRLRTPVAPVRTTTTCHEIQREEAVRSFPDVAVAFNVDEFSRWKRKEIQIAHRRPGERSHWRIRLPVEVTGAADLLDRHAGFFAAR